MKFKDTLEGNIYRLKRIISLAPRFTKSHQSELVDWFFQVQEFKETNQVDSEFERLYCEAEKVLIESVGVK